MKYTYGFREPMADRLEISGGKGSNLSRLTQQGFPVPPGFVVAAQAYRDFVAAGREFLREVDSFHFAEPARLRSESEDLRQKLDRLELLPGG